MHVLLFTGKGGVGKTTAAAASAVRAARAGVKTLVLSTDPAHSLADALGVSLGPVPTEIETGLAGMQVDPQAGFEHSWRDVQVYLRDLLLGSGVDPIEAEELTVLPGAGELLALLAVREQAESGPWELVVVDCAASAETLRLLALPDAFDWYLRRLWPAERLVARTLRPMIHRASPAASAGQTVFEAAMRLRDQLAGVRALLRDPERSSIRLVLTPESVVVAEARRTLTTLSLFGYRVDAVVANRVFPAGDPWRDAWAAAQSRQLVEVRDSFAPLPVLQVAYQPGEPVGVEALAGVGAELYAGDGVDGTQAAGVLGLPPPPDPMQVGRTPDGFELTLALPFAEKDELGLTRRGDEIAVTAGGWRRLITLPSALRRCVVTGAELTDGRLTISFEPDPDLWMGA